MPNLKETIGSRSEADTRLRSLVSEIINACPLSREQIAERMSVHAGFFISKHMLDGWTSEAKKPSRFPACLIQAFCDVVGNDRLQRWAVGPRLRKLLELGEALAALEADRVKPRTPRKGK